VIRRTLQRVASWASRGILCVTAKPAVDVEALTREEQLDLLDQL
jgi:hypothetical protein